MYLATWDLHIEASDPASQAADDADIAEVERMMQAAQFHSIYSDDYDPCADDEEDELSATKNDKSMETDESPPELGSEDPITRFPNYSWSVHQDAPDLYFRLAFPRADAVHGYGNITLPGLRSPCTIKDGTTTHRTYNKS